MIIGGDFGSDCVTFSPRHDAVDICDDGQLCFCLIIIYTNHQQFPSNSSIFIGFTFFGKVRKQIDTFRFSVIHQLFKLCVSKSN